MTPLTRFLLLFIVTSAVTALVNAMVAEDSPAAAARKAVRWFLYTVFLISGFSAFVFLLEMLFIRRS